MTWSTPEGDENEAGDATRPGDRGRHDDETLVQAVRTEFRRRVGRLWRAAVAAFGRGGVLPRLLGVPVRAVLALCARAGRALSAVIPVSAEPVPGADDGPGVPTTAAARPAAGSRPGRRVFSLAALKGQFDARRSARDARRVQWDHGRSERQRDAAERPDVGEDEADLAAAEDVAASLSPAPAGPTPEPGPFRLPGLDLLSLTDDRLEDDPEENLRNKVIIQETLDSFGIDAEVGRFVRGPRVTLFEVNPAKGVKVEAVSRISNNLAMELSAVSLRILAPVPGQDYIGIEVPNKRETTVRLGNLLAGRRWRESRAPLPLVVGRSITGDDVVLDLAKAPHLLVAGATGSGKSVCLNGLLMSLLYRFGPEDLRLILVDPKVVEFHVYNRVPHLIVPVVTQVEQVVAALGWAVREMERRYRVLAKVGVRNLEDFNGRPPPAKPVFDDAGRLVPARLPYIVILIDELADLILTAREAVEQKLARLAQMSRAVGIHTVIATQRPSVNIITGVIKANYPTRVAFQVSSQVDSRTILDGKGAESLLGRGDMLFKPPGADRLMRLQGPFIEDAEIERVVRHVSEQREPTFDLTVLKLGDEAAGGGGVEAGAPAAGEDEELVQKALEVIASDRRATTSYVQRRLRIGYNRAAMVMEILEQRGHIGPQIGSAPREIFVEAVAPDEAAAPERDGEP